MYIHNGLGLCMLTNHGMPCEWTGSGSWQDKLLEGLTAVALALCALLLRPAQLRHQGRDAEPEQRPVLLQAANIIEHVRGRL